jgi:protocatechuate 3,4-dioxygenase beta subunit
MLLTILSVLLLQLQSAPAARGGIEGMVSHAVTGESLAQAQVTLVRTDRTSSTAGPTSTWTDGNGKFRFADLAPGMYRLFAARNGFGSQEYGQRTASGKGTVLQIAEGQVLKSIALRLIPGAVLSGRIADAAGQSLPMANVTLWRSSYDEQGKRRWIVVKSTKSDDRGEYRLFWIPAGRYFLSAAPEPSLADSIAGMEIGFAGFGGFGGERPSPNDPEMVAQMIRSQAVVSAGHVATYHPSTVDISRASAIDVKPGDELAGLDVQMDPQPVFRIRGHLFDEKGQPPSSAHVAIGPRTPDGGSSKNATYTAASGLFEIRDVVAGSYLLSAVSGDMSGLMMMGIAQIGDPSNPAVRQALSLASQMPVPLTANQSVEVSSDIDNVVLRFKPGFSVQGQVTVSGMTSVEALPGAAALRVGLEAGPTAGDFVLPATVAANGTFTVKGLSGDAYRVYAELPPNTYIKSARLGSADVLDQAAIINEPGVEILRIEISPNPGAVEGTIRDAESNPVESIQAVLIPNNRERHDLYKVAISEPGGHFKFSSIAPGAYKLFAWEDLESNAWFDPEILEKYDRQGTAVTVSESQTNQIDLRMIRAPMR